MFDLLALRTKPSPITLNLRACFLIVVVVELGLLDAEVLGVLAGLNGIEEFGVIKFVRLLALMVRILL